MGTKLHRNCTLILSAYLRVLRRLPGNRVGLSTRKQGRGVAQWERIISGRPGVRDDHGQDFRSTALLRRNSDSVYLRPLLCVWDIARRQNRVKLLRKGFRHGGSKTKNLAVEA